jgi:hypothetical protein
VRALLLLGLSRQVTTEEGDARGREAGVLFIETSAKAGFNIKARGVHALPRSMFTSRELRS